MATDTVLVTRKRVMAAAVETTTGTAVAVGATQGVFNVFDHKLDATIPPTERQAQASMSALVPIPGARMGKYIYKTELYNAASAPPWLSVLLLSCGCQVSTGVYSPLTSAATTSTQTLYQDGSRQKVLTGCQGNAKFIGEYGKPVMAEWDFMGKWVAPATTSIIAPTYPTVIPPRFAGATLTVGGTAYRLGKFEFDLGNKVVMRQDVTDVTGYRAAFITERKPIIKIPVEALPFGTQDWYAAHLAMTTYAFSMAIGTGTNGILTLAATNLQLLNPPQDEDRDGLLLDSLEFLCTTSTADAEWTLTPS